jgi:hypothetical protein
MIIWLLLIGLHVLIITGAFAIHPIAGVIVIIMYTLSWLGNNNNPY